MAAGLKLPALAERPSYKGPNVVIVRFGGGVRRLETIHEDKTYSPFLLKELTKRGTFFPRMEIADTEDALASKDAKAKRKKEHELNTSHGEGTLYILTGTYRRYVDVGWKYDHIDEQLLGARFEATEPTLFEYLRRQFNVPEHQTLIVNGEDRPQEEFYSFSNHHLFGATFKSETLSLFRYKSWLYQRLLDEGKLDEKQTRKKTEALKTMRELDYRIAAKDQPKEIIAFWENWRRLYGDNGFVNERGDRLLTDLALKAMKSLQPRMMMINYNDPDYVHWGKPTHYTRGIAIIDRGLRFLVDAVEADPFYRDNTVFVIVPDCGRDSNPFMSVPFQHHFNSKSSREIWALLIGPGIEKGVVVDRTVQQIDLAKTIGSVMGFEAGLAEGGVLEEAIS